VVHDEAFPAQEDQQSAVAEPAALAGQRHQPRAQARIVRPSPEIAHRHAVAADHPAGQPQRITKRMTGKIVARRQASAMNR
jgi:hypothetical protein